ncbi:MAG: cysteinyl-tRNA synthetase, partial [Candidatus Berkelbacteria bacterium Licking1014_96]
LKPLEDNEVRIYSCGPTVYDYAHLGNLRTYIFSDVLHRVIELAGYRVKQVMNITDVGHLTSDEDFGEDKIEKGARREKKSPQEVAQFYTKAFLSDLKKLNIEIPKIMPKATDHIPEMIDFIKRIAKARLTYETKDGVYFNTFKAKDYGALSKQKIDLKRRSRIKKSKDKKSPTDFALWLKAVGRHKNHLQTWDSPWGRGFPSWHIECSAMSEKYLGREFDIHTGGVDHIPVHHENEIAQSAAANKVIPAKFWLHGAFLLVDKEKMAKSENNFLTLSDIIKKGFDPLIFRFLCLTNHYRSQMDFNWDEMDEAGKALKKIRSSIVRLKSLSDNAGRPEGAEVVVGQEQTSVLRLFYDDLNTPMALDKIFEVVRYINDPKISFSQKEIKKIISLFEKADQVLGLDLLEEIIIPSQIEKLAKERQRAKLEQNFKKSDIIRKKIEKEGYKIEDLDNKYRIIKM